MSLLFISLLEYTITMYDTKSRELRWNATYSDYASTLPDDDTKYSKTFGHAGSSLFVKFLTDGAIYLSALLLHRDGSFCVQR